MNGTTSEMTIKTPKTKPFEKPSLIPVLGIALTTLCAACAEPPVEAIESARDKLEMIAADDAAYAATQYAAAQELAGQLQAELQSQEDSFALTRSYERATELAAELEAAATNVQGAIETEKARLSADAERFKADAERMLSEARESLGELPEERAAELEGDAADVEASFGEIDGALRSGDLAEARRLAEAAQAAARRIDTAVSQAQAELQRAREEEAARIARGGITIPRTVMANGERLAPGPYQVRLTDEGATPVGEESPDQTRWVEFVRDGAVVGRELAWVVPDAEIGEITEPNEWRPRNEIRVDELVEADYVRLWINRDGNSYLLHLPIVTQ